MRLLHESDVNHDLARLDRAWDHPESFLFVPERSGADTRWLEDALHMLPADLREHHFVLLTSGSTGRPKLIVGLKERAEALASVLHGLQGSAPAQAALLSLPLTYSYAFVNQWLWSRLHDRGLVVTRGFAEPDRLRQALFAIEDGMLCMVGGQLSLFAQYFGADTFKGIIRLHFAGGAFPQDRLPDLRRWFPNAQVFNNYGCAEAMPRLALRHAEAAFEANDVGPPLPGIEMRTGDAGDIQFRSPYGAVGYIDHDGYHDIHTETWVTTGDLGMVGPDGHWQIHGRAGEVFKRYGEKISIFNLRACVAASWQGQLAFYRERDRAGEEGHVLVLSPHPNAQEVRTLLGEFRKGFPRTHWPLRIESVAQLPLLANGKLDMQLLAQKDYKDVHWDQRV